MTRVMNETRLLVVVLVIVLLVAVSMLTFSCGKKETGTRDEAVSKDDSSTVPTPESIDNAIEEIDEEINSLDAEGDFGDSKLGNSELGL